MSYLDEAEKIKQEAMRKKEELEKKVPLSGGKDGEHSRLRHEIDLWFSHEITKLQEKYKDVE